LDLFLILYIVISGILIAGLVFLFPEFASLESFLFGYLVFSINIVLFVLIFRSFFSRSSVVTNNNKEEPAVKFPGAGFLMIGTIGKFIFLGVAIYLGLAVLEYSPFYLVGGAVASLGLTSLLAATLYLNGRF
jgi:hypothetical protein